MKYTLHTWINTTFVGILIAFGTNADENIWANDQLQSNDLVQTNRSKSMSVSSGMDYAPMPLERLIGLAALIAIGTVESVDDRQLSIRIDESSQSIYDGESIIIKQAKELDFLPPRPVPYAKGQQFVFFLVKADNRTDGRSLSLRKYQIAGALPIDAGFVYFDSYDLKVFSFESFNVHGVTRPMQRFDLVDFKNAVMMYQNCFSWTQTEQVKNLRKITRWIPAQVCDNMTLHQYQGRSRIHKYLTRKTLRQIPGGKKLQQ